MLELFLKSDSLWEVHAGLIWEGQQPVGGTPCGSGAESEGAADMKLYGLTLFLCTAWDWEVEECE